MGLQQDLRGGAFNGRCPEVGTRREANKILQDVKGTAILILLRISFGAFAEFIQDFLAICRIHTGFLGNPQKLNPGPLDPFLKSCLGIPQKK